MKRDHLSQLLISLIQQIHEIKNKDKYPTKGYRRTRKERFAKPFYASCIQFSPFVLAWKKITIDSETDFFIIKGCIL